MGLAEDTILAVSLGAHQPSRLGGQGPETILSLPLKHRGKSAGAQHSQPLWHQLFNVNILLLLLRFFPGLCCGSSPKPLVFPQLALTVQPCSQLGQTGFHCSITEVYYASRKSDILC